MITGLYAAIFALLQAAMIPWIAKSRMKEKTSLGTGSNALNAKIRTYGNFIEIIPLALILMLLAELSGAPFWSIHGLGLIMITSRLLHAKGILTPPSYGIYRMVGMIFSITVFILGAILNLYLYLTL
ncbi:MAG: MAPEG family protein [Alphaproteobacteria bacterium]